MNTERKAHADAEKETSRIEAFSDGVFAIAITLLALDIKVPRAADLAAAHQGLPEALLRQWPTYVAYLVSFVTVLIMWMNHHKMFQQIRRVDHAFLVLNGFLLMWVTLVPFPTSLLAEYIYHPYARLAAGIYSGFFVMIAVSFNAAWRYASARGRLLGANHDPEAVSAITRQYRYGPLAYLISFALSYVSVEASVGACMLLAAFFALPGTAGATVKGQGSSPRL